MFDDLYTVSVKGVAHFVVFTWDCWILRNYKFSHGNSFVRVPDIEGSFRDLEVFKQVPSTIWEALAGPKVGTGVWPGSDWKESNSEPVFTIHSLISLSLPLRTLAIVCQRLYAIVAGVSISERRFCHAITLLNSAFDFFATPAPRLLLWCAEQRVGYG